MINAIILAAGKGTRMKSDLPKVLHPILEVPMIQYVVDGLKTAGVTKSIAVVGHKAELVQAYLKDQVEYVYQYEQNGTGHAVMQAIPLLKDIQGVTLIVCGDNPLTTSETFDQLIKQHINEKNSATVLSAIEEQPTGYGRIIRNEKGNVCKIVEEKDANAQEKLVTEINTGTYCFDNALLMDALGKLTTDNAQNEYYLTDVIKILDSQNLKVGSMVLEDKNEAIGINDKLTLSKVETILKETINTKHMLNGVTIIDPSHTYIGKDVEIGNDSIIYPGSMLLKNTKVGKGCIIGPATILRNATVGDQSIIKQSDIEDSNIGSQSKIGPYARIREHANIGDHVNIGNFVEMKKANFGNLSRAAHLTYIGDAEVGEDVNIGCGSITVNYDGFHKFKTIIEDQAFIGCNTNLIAPVKVSKRAITAAGSTITDDVPEDSIAIGRTRQENKVGYAIKYREERGK